MRIKLWVAALVFTVMGLTVGVAAAVDPITDLSVSAASYFGGDGSDTANGVDVTPSKAVLTVGTLPGDNPDGIPTMTLDGIAAGDGVVLRLDGDGQSILSLTRVGETVNDVQSNNAGNVVICGDFGVAVTDETVNVLVWADDLGGAEGYRCAIDETGYVAVVIDSGPDRIEVFEADGTPSASWDSGSGGRHYNDVAVDSTNDLVVFTGYEQKASDLQVAFLTAFAYDGSSVWTSYDFSASAVKGANLAADSRGRRVSIGADGLLYFAATVDGGNAIFNRDPKDLGASLSDDVLIKYDEYNNPFNLSGAKTLTWYGRFNPATGDVILGQFLLTRLSDSGGNSISPRGITADVEGRVFLTGQAFASIENRDSRQVNGVTVGGYGGGEAYLLIVEPDFRQRTVWTPFVAPGAAGGGSSGAGVSVRGGTVAMAATLSLDDANRDLITANAFDETAAGGSEGYAVVLPNVGGPGVALIETDGGTLVQEGGTGDSYSIQLTTEPSGTVTISATYDDSLITVSPAVLTFGPSDWDQPQPITVEAVNNSVINSTTSAVIAHAVSGADYDGVLAPSLTLTLLDDEVDFTNLLTNGSFEDELDPAWDLRTSGGAVNRPFTFSNAPDGVRVMLFDGTSGVEGVEQLVTFPGAEGDQLTLRFMIGGRDTSTSGFIGAQVILQAEDGSVLQTCTTIQRPRQDTFAPAELTCLLEAETDYASIFVRIGGVRVPRGFFGFDDARLSIER